MWPFTRISILQYAALAIAAFGVWQLGLGGVMLFREWGTQAPADADGASVSLIAAVSGLVAIVSAALLLTRRPFARLFAMWWLSFHTLMFLLGPSPETPADKLALDVKIGAAPLWLMSALLAILLMNRSVAAEFSVTRRNEAEP